MHRASSLAWPLVAAVMVMGLVAGCRTTPADPSSPTERERPLVERARAFCEGVGWPAGLPTRPFSTDGCSAWPDGSLYACCVEHDIEYWCGGTAAQRKAADRRLRECAERIDYGAEGMVYFGVRLGGPPWLPTPWRWGYGHAYGTGYAIPDAGN